ncbi:MAG: DUF5694 domain-containing protein [Gemmatimonadaceae bacterium]|jgi:hypothetical protein|nr:DUF5694 domain-containing protein [Gemmatimonadaceae bacterium]
MRSVGTTAAVSGRHAADHAGSWPTCGGASSRGDRPCSQWNARYDSLTALNDTLRARLSTLAYLRHLNSDEQQARSNGRWLVTTKLGINVEPIGADGFLARYFVRNLRVFSNVQRVMARDDDRVLVLFGNTHGYLLRALFRAAPEYSLRDVSEILGKR